MKRRIQRPGLLLSLVIAMALLLAWNLSYLKVENHLDAFFPVPQSSEQFLLHDTLTQSLEQDQGHQPVMLAVVADRSASKAELAQTSMQLQARLEKQTWVERVENGPPPLSEFKNAELMPYRYLLGESDLSKTGLKNSLADLWKDWQIGLVWDKPLSLADLTRQWPVYLHQTQFQSELAVTDGVWVTDSHDSSPQALLLVYFSDDASQSHLPSLRSFHHLMERFQVEHPAWRLFYSSPAWIAFQSRNSIEKTTQWLSIVATLTILLFLIWRLRSPLWVGMSFVPLVFSALVSLALVSAVFGYVEALAVALGVVLIGVAVDYPIHILTALRQGKTCAYDAWLLVKLGAFTTAAGFASLSVLDVTGLQQIALFASVGIVAALLASGLVLGSLSEPGDNGQAEPLPKASGIWRKGAVVLSGLVGLAAIGVGLNGPQWQDDLASLSPVPQSILQQDGRLRAQFGQAEAGQMLVMTAPDVETLLQRQEALMSELANLRQSGQIADSLMLANFLPSQSLQGKRQASLPEPAELQARLIQALDAVSVPFTPSHFHPFLTQVEQSRQLAPLTLKTYSERASDWQKEWLPLLVNQRSQGLVGKVLLSGVAAPDSIAEWADSHGYLYFHQRRFVADAVSELRSQLFPVFGIFIGLMLVMLTVMKWRGRPLWQAFYEAASIMLPVLAGAFLTYATLVVFNQSLTVFHLLAGLLLMGIALDYSLFAYQARQASRHLRSVEAALMTTLIAFGLLLFTGIPILVAIGQVLAVGVLWSYLSARFYFRI